MKKFYLLILFSLNVFVVTNAQDCSDLFFSEYVEGTDNSKALEIFNPTNQIVDLGKYYVARYSNGASNYTAGGITQLQGFLLPKSVFVLVNGQTVDLESSTKCAPELQAKANQLDHAYPAPTYMNGNDAIALFKDPTGTGNAANFVAIDLFGTIGGGMQPADEGWTNFTNKFAYRNVKNLAGEIVGKDSIFITNYIAPEGWFFLPWTANHTLVRKPSVRKGVTAIPSSFNVTLEWDTLSSVVNDWSNLGAYYSGCSFPTAAEKDFEISKVEIYPNPVTEGCFTVNSYKPLIGIEMVNSLGQVIRSRSLKINENSSEVQIDEPCKGLLIIKLRFADSECMIRKIIIQ